MSRRQDAEGSAEAGRKRFSFSSRFPLSAILASRRLKPGSLEIRLKAQAGELPRHLDVSVFYPRRVGAYGGPATEETAPGVFRLDRAIIPGRDAEVIVLAEGFKPLMARPFRLIEEGQEGVVEITLVPGKDDDPDGGFRLSDAVAVTLKDRAGRPDRRGRRRIRHRAAEG